MKFHRIPHMQIPIRPVMLAIEFFVLVRKRHAFKSRMEIPILLQQKIARSAIQAQRRPQFHRTFSRQGHRIIRPAAPVRSKDSLVLPRWD